MSFLTFINENAAWAVRPFPSQLPAIFLIVLFSRLDYLRSIFDHLFHESPPNPWHTVVIHVHTSNLGHTAFPLTPSSPVQLPKSSTEWMNHFYSTPQLVGTVDSIDGRLQYIGPILWFLIFWYWPCQCCPYPNVLEVHPRVRLVNIFFFSHNICMSQGFVH